MRSEQEIKAKIAEVEADSRYQSGQECPATIGINAPLALVQLELETRLNTLKWVLESQTPCVDGSIAIATERMKREQEDN